MEHWFIVNGSGQITIAGVVTEFAPGGEVNFGIGVLHRIANTGTEEIIFIEVQTGTYFDEEDIGRVQVDFGR